MTERSDLAGAITFIIVLAVFGAAVLLMLLLDPGDLREAVAGFVGGIVAVLAVGVARWMGGGRGMRRRNGGE